MGCFQSICGIFFTKTGWAWHVTICTDFTAEFYDPDQWADILKASGAKWVKTPSVPCCPSTPSLPSYKDYRPDSLMPVLQCILQQNFTTLISGQIHVYWKHQDWQEQNGLKPLPIPSTTCRALTPSFLPAPDICADLWQNSMTQVNGHKNNRKENNNQFYLHMFYISQHSILPSPYRKMGRMYIYKTFDYICIILLSIHSQPWTRILSLMLVKA